MPHQHGVREQRRAPDENCLFPRAYKFCGMVVLLVSSLAASAFSMVIRSSNSFEWRQNQLVKLGTPHPWPFSKTCQARPLELFSLIMGALSSGGSKRLGALGAGVPSSANRRIRDTSGETRFPKMFREQKHIVCKIFHDVDQNGSLNGRLERFLPDSEGSMFAMAAMATRRIGFP